MRTAIVSLISMLLLSACTPASGTVHETRFMMGTLVDFTVYGTNKDSASIAIKAAADEMQRIEHLFTIYGESDNDVKQFNAAAVGLPLTLPDEIDALLDKSVQISAESGGAFSATLGVLNMLWGFSMPTPPGTPPATDEIARLAKASANCLQQLSGQRWKRSNANCQLDFGAIAKGYALDRGMKALKAHGVENAIINAGGDIRVSGSHGERPWQVGIRHPRKPGEIIATLKIKDDVSIVTSGDYERFYIFGGMRYHHILDPRSGWPAGKSQSATVIAKNATTADGWSTALFVMGAEGLQTIEKQGMDAIVVDAEGGIHTTSGAESRLQLTLAPPMLRTSGNQ